jgi:cyclic pyranopterin phosphate synthase
MALTHLDRTGAARMVDVSGKPPVKRTARAAAAIRLAPATLRLIRAGLVKKGDVLAVARLAGIGAAKKTAELIPLCHAIRLDWVAVDFAFRKDGLAIVTTAAGVDKTGVEMEALTAAAVAALTIYDMCKGVEQNIRIERIRLLEKTKPAEKA